MNLSLSLPAALLWFAAPDPRQRRAAPHSPASGGHGHRRHLLRDGVGDWLLPETLYQEWRGFLPGGPGDDGLGGGTELYFRQPRRPGTDGLGGRELPVRHPGNALVLDWRHPGHPVPGPRHDAVLLHFQNPFRSRLPAAPLRRIHARPQRHFLRLHDRFDVGHQYVCDGPGDEGGSGLEHPLQHLGVFASPWRSTSPWAGCSPRSSTRCCNSS